MKTLDQVVQEALASFQRLDAGGAAPTVVVQIDGGRASATWTNPENSHVTVQPYSFEKSYKRSCKCHDCSIGRDVRGIKKATRLKAKLAIKQDLLDEQE